MPRRRELYEQPANAFVARFIGENNRLDGAVGGGERKRDARCGSPATPGSRRRWPRPLAPGSRVTVSLRPERVQLAAVTHTIPRTPGCNLAGTLREVIYLGDHVRARVALPGNDDFTVKRPIDEAHKLPQTGGAVELAWVPEHCRALAREDEAVQP